MTSNSKIWMLTLQVCLEEVEEAKVILSKANKGEVKLPVNNANDEGEANTQNKTIKTKISAHRMRYSPKVWYLKHPL